MRGSRKLVKKKEEKETAGPGQAKEQSFKNPERTEAGGSVARVEKRKGK